MIQKLNRNLLVLFVIGLVVSPSLSVAQNGSLIEPVESYNGQTVKSDARVFYPKSMEEYSKLLKRLYKDGIKFRVVGHTHTTSDIMMSDGVFVSTKNLNKIRRVFKKDGKNFLEVEPGVTLGQMDEYLSKRNLSLGLGFPMFRDLSIAGIVSTGSHGSSWTHNSMTSHAVGAMNVLDPATGKWISLDRSQNEGNYETDRADFEVLKDLSESTLKKMILGLSASPSTLTAKEQALRRLLFRYSTVDLGASFQKGLMTIEVQPQFNLHVKTQAVSTRDMFLESEKKIRWNPNRSESGFDNSLVVKFYFHADQAIIESGNISNIPAAKGAQNVNFGTFTESPEALTGARDFMAKAHVDMAYGVTAEPLRVKGTLAAPLFVVQDEQGKEVRTTDVVGASENLTRARGDKLTWLFRPSDYSFSFPESKAFVILKDIEAFAKNNGYSFPFTGVSCRFVTSDPGAGPLSHVGKPGDSPGERYVVMEFLEYRPLEHKGPTLQTDRTKYLNELIDLLKSHNIGLHWGKNSTEIFDPKYLRGYYGNTLEIASWLRNVTDPKDLIGDKFTRRILTATPAKNSCIRFYK